jgi:hypothetical protein
VCVFLHFPVHFSHAIHDDLLFSTHLTGEQLHAVVFLFQIEPPDKLTLRPMVGYTSSYSPFDGFSDVADFVKLG